MGRGGKGDVQHPTKGALAQEDQTFGMANGSRLILEARMNSKETTEMNLEGLLQALANNRNVAGIVNYGSRSATATEGSGDVDLLVIVDKEPEHVESLHIWVGNTPVDLNIRSLHDLLADRPLTSFDSEMIGGVIIYDRGGTLQDFLATAVRRWVPQSSIWNESDTAFIRFTLSHAMHKAHSHLEDDHLLARYIMSTQLYWIVHTYLMVAGEPFRGEKKALDWLKNMKPEVYVSVERFLDATLLQEMSRLYEWLTRDCLSPIGGIWDAGEPIALARDSGCTEDLQSRGRAVLKDLLNSEFIGG